jgi:hypothetical protein
LTTDVRETKERALLMRGVPVGGELRLAEANLSWTRSKAESFGIILDKGPAKIDVWLGDIVALKDGRRPAWTEIILCTILWGFILPFLLLRPSIWLGPFDILLMTFTGGFRRTLEVRTQKETFYFSVKSVDRWLSALDEAAKRHNAGSPVINPVKELS